MASNQKRVLKELTECTNDPPQGTRVRLVDEADVMRWEVLMDGPDGSVYAVRPPIPLPESS
jgi:ubiquitin-protein ligase